MKDEEEILDAWQKRTDRVSAGVFDRYFLDGNTRRLAALRRLEDAFDKVRRAGAAPVLALWGDRLS